jgi:hypothetical protein
LLGFQQEVQAKKQERNFVDVWEPKKGNDKLSSFIHNSYECWIVLFVSVISYFFASMVSAIFFLTFSLLFFGMVQTQTRRYAWNKNIMILNFIIWVVCIAMKILYITKVHQFVFTDREKFKETIIFQELIGIYCKYAGGKNDLEAYLKSPSTDQ